jgi:hypothetical protein
MTDIVEIIADLTETTVEIANVTSVDIIEIESAGIIPGPTGPTGPVGGVSSTLTTRILITGNKAVSSIYSTTSSGVNYTQAGDDGDIGESAEVFNASCSVFVFLNGLNLTKGTQVIWLSATSFQLEAIVDNGDAIVILS